MLKKIALLGAATAALVSTGANAATVTAQAEVDIVAAITLTQNAPLDFGVVAASTTAGTVVLPTANNNRTCSGGVTCASTAQRGTFTVSNATNGYAVTITVPATISLVSGANSMSLALTPSMTNFTSAGTDQVFYVGGTLSVGASQPAGTYRADYNVSADYQ